MDIKRVPMSVVEEVTAPVGKQDKWKPVIDAVRELPEGEAVALTVEASAGTELKRRARTMQQNIITAGKRHNFEVQVRLHQDYHTVYVLPKPKDAKPAAQAIDTMAVKFGNKDNQLVILNADEVKASNADLHQSISAYEKKPFGVQKGRLQKFLKEQGVAFVEEQV